jgi:hypothetical protein
MAKLLSWMTPTGLPSTSASPAREGGESLVPIYMVHCSKKAARARVPVTPVDQKRMAQQYLTALILRSMS